MDDDTDPILETMTALRAAGIKAIPTGHDIEFWQIGDVIYSDTDVLRLAESPGLVEDGASR